MHSDEFSLLNYINGKNYRYNDLDDTVVVALDPATTASIHMTTSAFLNTRQDHTWGVLVQLEATWSNGVFTDRARLEKIFCSTRG